MKQTDQQAREASREQCRRQMDRPAALRIKYGFNRVYKPFLDDAPWRSFDTMAEYRERCERNLPKYLGFRRSKEAVEPEMLEDFRSEYEKRHSKPLRTVRELAKRKPRKAR